MKIQKAIDLMKFRIYEETPNKNCISTTYKNMFSQYYADMEDGRVRKLNYKIENCVRDKVGLTLEFLAKGKWCS